MGGNRSVTDIRTVTKSGSTASLPPEDPPLHGIVHAQREKAILLLVSDETYPRILELLKTADNFSTI